MQAVCMELLPLFFQLKCKPWCAVCGNYYSCIFKTVIFRFKSVQIHYFTLTLQCVLKMRIEQLLP